MVHEEDEGGRGVSRDLCRVGTTVGELRLLGELYPEVTDVEDIFQWDEVLDQHLGLIEFLLLFGEIELLRSTYTAEVYLLEVVEATANLRPILRGIAICIASLGPVDDLW